jgi:long-chain acyl-CoA synthetase
MPDAPWIASYPTPARWDAPLELGPVAEILDGAAREFGDRPAVEFMGRRATYRELNALANRAATGFQGLGVRPGVHVGLYMPNTPHYLIAFFGVLKAGGTVVNYSPLDAAQVLAHKIEDSETAILVTLDMPPLLPQMEALLGTARFKTLVVGSLADLAAFPQYAGSPAAGGSANGAGGRMSFHALLDNDGAFQTYPIGDPAETIAVIQYTGGTTGLPKGAMLTHANLTAATSQYLETTKVDPPVLTPGEERTLLVLPLFHIYSLTACMLLCVRLGAEMVLHPRFDLEAVAKDLSAKKITIFMGVPTMFTALLAYPGLAQLDWTSMKYTASGGAPLPLEVQQRFQDVTGTPLCEGWGMTETSPSGTFTPMRGMRKAGSCGIPVPQVDLKFASVTDPSQYVPLGERGEICIKGPNVMKGYWKNEAATRDSMTADGYFRTGDVAYMDSDGFVFIVDRIKDMLLCGGYNVYPRNVEEAVYRHPAVAECCAVGVPDAYRGETVKLYVVRRPGAALTAEQLRDFLKGQLSPIEMPKFVEFRDALPKTPVGKISRKMLAEEEASRRAPA